MVSVATRHLALIGNPILHSKSVDMMNAVFTHMREDFLYTAYNVEKKSLCASVNGLRALGFRGWNVTLPHKVDILEYLDQVDDTAQEIGAVNTVVNVSGKLVGYNTDGAGYLRSLREEINVDISSQHVVILGSGGAARSVGVVLAKEGVQSISIVNRTTSKAEEMEKVLSKYTKTKVVSFQELEGVMEGATLLINATSVGMSPNLLDAPVPERYLHADLIVSDLVYNPKYTALLTAAVEKGATVHCGLGMFVYQGAGAIELWTGKRAPVRFMRKCLEEILFL